MAYTTVNKHTDYFNTKTWTGTSDATTSVTGVGFQPDWVWVKNRDVADDHMLFDAVRGVTKRLFSNSTGAEGTDTETLTSFDSDGFTTGNSRATGGDAGNDMVSWNWKANGAGSANTDGSISSTVSVNTTAGFSIVSYTGTATSGVTIGHGLGVKPDMIILKNRSPDTASWPVYHSSLGATKYLGLNSTGTSTTSNTRWNDTEPTSTVFTLGSSGDVVGDSSGEPFIAYCFAEKTGYSKFGSYIGNGNADGSFVYTGFKPTWILAKHASGGTASGEHWNLQDVKRSPYNSSIIMLSPNQSSADNSTTNNSIDILSNGFKIRTNDGRLNNAGATYIYMAFGQTLVGSNNIPCTAR